MASVRRRLKKSAPRKPEKAASPSKSASESSGSKPKKTKKIKKGSKRDAREFASGVVSILRKKVPKGSTSEIGLLSEADILSEITEWIPSGFPALDVILGGGWPVGRCVEIFGAEGAGKSAQTHMAIKACQEAGGTVLYIDFETALDPEKLEQLGIDRQSLIYCSPDTLEEAWDLIYAMLDELRENPPAAPTLIVWDSIAASVPRKILEGDAGDSNVALVARSMSANCGKVMRKIAKVRACLMWVNQERAKIGSSFGFGPQYQTTGGAAVRYACSTRIQLRRVMTIKQGKIATGYLIRPRTVKNRCYPPHRDTTWVLDFRAGPSTELTMLFHLKDAKVVKTKKGQLTAPWLDGGTFKRKDWIDLYHTDADFRAAADAAYEERVLPPLRKLTLDENADSVASEDEDEE